MSRHSAWRRLTCWSPGPEWRCWSGLRRRTRWGRGRLTRWAPGIPGALSGMGLRVVKEAVFRRKMLRSRARMWLWRRDPQVIRVGCQL